MRRLKRLFFWVIVFLALPLIAFWGFQQNFPGKFVADALSSHLTAQTGFPLKIQPLELGWTKIMIPELVLQTPKRWAGTPEARLLVFENLEAPFWPLLSSGTATLQGNFHEGKLQATTNLPAQKTLALSLEGVELGRMPLLAVIPYVFVTGTLSLTTDIKNFQVLQQQKNSFPQGNLQGVLNNFRVRFSGGGMLFAELQLPELEFSEVEFDLLLGRMISIRKIQIKGSLKGNIEGTIQLNEKNPQLSGIDLNIRLTPSPALKKELSGLAPMLRSLQCGETVNINLKGTLSRSHPTRRNCS